VARKIPASKGTSLTTEITTDTQAVLSVMAYTTALIISLIAIRIQLNLLKKPILTDGLFAYEQTLLIQK
jgi:hypothetical protein